MEIGKKIMELRKKKGLSQEELADKVGVARQTISKWELGETSPDIKQAKELSKIFNVSLDELVDNDTSNTEKLAGLILKLIRFSIIFIIAIPILLIGTRIIFKNIYEKNAGRLMEVTINCNLHDKDYSYGFVYHENNGEIKYAGGDGYISNVTDVTKYSDAYQALDIIDAYIVHQRTSCQYLLSCKVEL